MGRRNCDETFSPRKALLSVWAETQFPSKSTYLGLGDISSHGSQLVRFV